MPYKALFGPFLPYGPDGKQFPNIMKVVMNGQMQKQLHSPLYALSLPYSQHVPAWFFSGQQPMSLDKIRKSTDLRTNIKYLCMNKTCITVCIKYVCIKYACIYISIYIYVYIYIIYILYIYYIYIYTHTHTHTHAHTWSP